jgi:hypothetical protein
MRSIIIREISSMPILFQIVGIILDWKDFISFETLDNSILGIDCECHLNLFDIWNDIQTDDTIQIHKHWSRNWSNRINNYHQREIIDADSVWCSLYHKRWKRSELFWMLWLFEFSCRLQISLDTMIHILIHRITDEFNCGWHFNPIK